MQSRPRRVTANYYVCAQHDHGSNVGETGDRTSSELVSPLVSLPTSRKAPNQRHAPNVSESVDWGSQSMDHLPTSRKARRHTFVDDDDASNADENTDRTSSLSRDPSVTIFSTGLTIRRADMETVGSQDSGNSNSWEMMPALTGNKITVVRFPNYVRAMSPRPAPVALPAVVVGRTPWHVWFTKASITLTVLSAAAMVGQDLVQVFAILTMFSGFLFVMGSI